MHLDGYFADSSSSKNLLRDHLLRSFAALEGTPSEIDLDRVSKKAGDKWRSLLTHLGVPSAKCNALFVESRGDPVSACFEGLVFWKEGNEPCRPPTWSVLLEALEKGAEKREYAKRLREILIESSNISQSKFDHMKISVLRAGTSTSTTRAHDLSRRLQ